MRIKLFPLIAVCALLMTSCTDYQSEIDKLKSEIDQTSEVLESLDVVSANLGALRDVMAFVQTGDYIESIVPSGKGYTFTFKNNGSVTVGGNTAGISVGAADGDYYWTLGGTPLKDATGANANVKVSPKVRAKDGKPQISTDSGKTWKEIALESEPVVKKVEDETSCMRVTFLGGAEVAFPKQPALTVLFSGDGTTIATSGRVVVHYFISGGSGDYKIATSQPNGWTPMIVAENGSRGAISFVAFGTPESDQVSVFVSDASGLMTVTKLNLSELRPDEDFPVLNPTYDAYNIGCDGGDLEVKVNTSLDYDVTIESSAASWLSYTGTKALRTDSHTFTAAPNEDFSMRIATVTFSTSDFTRTVAICQEGRLRLPGSNLSENGTANCYIVPGEGDYYFDATVIGNGQQGIIEGGGFHTESATINPAEVDISWEFNEETLIEDLRLEDGKICFHATGAKGNITLYVMDEYGAVLWSWHLWCTDMPSDKTHTNDNGQQFTLMDRNLGATSADPADGEATYGLYYQWGRKDPFAASSIYEWVKRNTALTVDLGVELPMLPLTTDLNHSYNWIGDFNYYLWGNPDTKTSKPLEELQKTIYDPCPPGYMVPPANTFVIFTDKTRLQFITNGFILRGDYGQTSFYPYAGRVYQSSYDAFGYNPDEISAALWNSCAAIYNTSVYDGGACMYFRVKTLNMAINKGDFCARGIPVRCVKQK